MNDSTEALLFRAAELLDDVGWCQGELGSIDDGKLCLVGALFSAFDELGGSAAQICEAITSAGLPCTTAGLELAAWNDTPGRTRAEVTILLRRAACGAAHRLTFTRARA